MALKKLNLLHVTKTLLKATIFRIIIMEIIIVEYFIIVYVSESTTFSAITSESPVIKQ